MDILLSRRWRAVHRKYLAAVVVIRADAVCQRRAHVVHAAERRELDLEAVCARTFGCEGSPRASVIKDPVVAGARAPEEKK